MSTKEKEYFGGNEISYYAETQYGKQPFADSPYEYYLYASKQTETINVANLKSYTVYAYQTSKPINIHTTDKEFSLSEGDSFQVENLDDVAVNLPAGAKVLIAGTVETKISESSATATKHDDIKKVIKPWGHELWISDDHPNYALKQIAIKQGTKTSLQYHRFKRETNVLFSGTARLHFKTNDAAQNDSVQPADVSITDLNPVSSIDVMPDCLHRLEAMTDVLLYEVSTPHLDDVIRVSDDTARADGRINAEHVNR
jgi:mannose-6-phosphate isomerase